MVASPLGPSTAARQGLASAAPGRLAEELDGQWTLESIAGQGGMSTVYRARHRDGHLVAIKLLHAHLAQSPGARARFLAEANVSRRLTHPGVVAVVGQGELPDGLPFLVMELLAGQSLSERLRAGRLPPVEAIIIAVRVLETLAQVHDQGVIHRDIKPANIFLTTDGGVKLLDFGVARVPHDLAAADYLTGEGAVLGTPEFMSPEQAGGSNHEVDARSDVFSVGATLYFCLTGHPIHRSRTSNEALVAAATRTVASLSEAAPGSPDALVAIVDRALAFDVEDRWPNARAMAHALAATLAPEQRANLGVFDTLPTLPETAPTRGPSPRGPSPRGPSPRERSAWRIGALSFLVSLGLIGLASLLHPAGAPTEPALPPAPAAVSAPPSAPPAVAAVSPGQPRDAAAAAPSLAPTATAAPATAPSLAPPRRAPPAPRPAARPVDPESDDMFLDRRK